MLNPDHHPLDPELIFIVTQAEHCLVEVEEMSSGSYTSELDQLGDDVVPVSSCCVLAATIPSPVRSGLGSLLKEFSKYSSFNLWGMSE